MAVIFVCDACGKQEPGQTNGAGGWSKPGEWFSRTPKGERTELVACSRRCVERLNADRGETTPIIPL